MLTPYFLNILTIEDNNRQGKDGTRMAKATCGSAGKIRWCRLNKTIAA